MKSGREGLMVIDMQEGFLGNFWVPDTQKDNIGRLVSNTCDLVSDSIRRKKKIFIVEFDGYGEIHPQIQKVLPSTYIRVLKNKPYFPLLENFRGSHGVTYDELCEIDSMSLSGVHTNHCVREAYRTISDIGIRAKLVLGATLNICNSGTSLGFVRNFYIQKNGLSASFLGEEASKSSLEDYL